MALPVRGVAYDFYTSLVSQASSNEFQVNPTIASGDFQISIDGGTLANLATLPVVTPAGGVGVLVALSAVEMDAEKIQVIAIDASGAEWYDVMVFLDVPDSSEETVLDILEGDHVENKTSLKIFRKDTSSLLVDKVITGSLLKDGVTISTSEAP